MKRQPKEGVPNTQKARTLVFEALGTDGAHHKQWYLEQIGAALGMDMEWQREYNTELGGEALAWEPGVAP